MFEFSLGMINFPYPLLPSSFDLMWYLSMWRIPLYIVLPICFSDLPVYGCLPKVCFFDTSPRRNYSWVPYFPSPHMVMVGPGMLLCVPHRCIVSFTGHYHLYHIRQAILVGGGMLYLPSSPSGDRVPSYLKVLPLVLLSQSKLHNIHILITSQKEVDNSILTYVWSKPLLKPIWG